MVQAKRNAAEKTARLKRNGLIVECIFNDDGRLASKIERFGLQSTEYAYQYDGKGHLIKLRRNGSLVESYEYNHLGQRIEQKREYRGFSDSTEGGLRYDGEGRLIRAGDTAFYYNRHGTLAERCDSRGTTRYSYGSDTMPDKVVLPSGMEIRYEYDEENPINPARRFRNGTLTTEYVWAGPLRLSVYRDHCSLLDYTFQYDASGNVSRVRIDAFTPSTVRLDSDATGTDWLEDLAAQKRNNRLHDFLGKRTLPMELLCCCDQVGTLKLLTDKSGRLVKEVVRGSFGVQTSDSFPDLFMPIGFAGGLTDPDTGLVRFGYRDYDPSVGRFTALDPARDGRGDGDLYDYCVDDPINAIDPMGLMSCSARIPLPPEEQGRMESPATPVARDGAEQPAEPQAQAQAQGQGEAAAPAQAQGGQQESQRQWTYNQRTGQLRDPDGALELERGYSGIPLYRNNPEAQRLGSQGPIPQGPYIVGRDVGTKGPLTLVLTPDGHDALGRTLLRIHGDSIKRPGQASTGCVILNRRQRTAIHRSGDRRLLVVDEPEWQR